MLTFCSARAWQSLPSVPGRSSKRIVNSLLVGMVGTSLRCTSGMGWKGPARSYDVSHPTPTTCLHQGRNEIALLFVVHNDVVYVTPLRVLALECRSAHFPRHVNEDKFPKCLAVARYLVRDISRLKYLWSSTWIVAFFNSNRVPLQFLQGGNLRPLMQITSCSLACSGSCVTV